MKTATFWVSLALTLLFGLGTYTTVRHHETDMFLMFATCTILAAAFTVMALRESSISKKES
jgi:hypothetical protein